MSSTSVAYTRRVLVAAVLIVGVGASIATSGMGELHAQQRVSTYSVADLADVVSTPLRTCVAPPPEMSRFEPSLELGVRLEVSRDGIGAFELPLHLVTPEEEYSARLASRLPIVELHAWFLHRGSPDEVRCTDWIHATVGPVSDAAAPGSVTLTATATAPFTTSGFASGPTHEHLWIEVGIPGGIGP